MAQAINWYELAAAGGNAGAQVGRSVGVLSAPGSAARHPPASAALVLLAAADVQSHAAIHSALQLCARNFGIMLAGCSAQSAVRLACLLVCRTTLVRCWRGAWLARSHRIPRQLSPGVRRVRACVYTLWCATDYSGTQPHCCRLRQVPACGAAGKPHCAGTAGAVPLPILVRSTAGSCRAY